MYWVSLQTEEKTHLQKEVSGYAKKEQALQEEILQMSQQVTQLESELTAIKGRVRGTQHLSTQPVGERAKQNESATAVQQHSSASGNEGPVSSSSQQENERRKRVLDLSMQGLLTSLAARNNKLAAEAMEHDKVHVIAARTTIIHTYQPTC